MTASAPARDRPPIEGGGGRINPPETLAPYRDRDPQIASARAGAVTGEMTVSAYGIRASGSLTREKLFTVAKGAVGMGGLTVLALGAFAPNFNGLAIATFAGLIAVMGAIVGYKVVGH